MNHFHAGSGPQNDRKTAADKPVIVEWGPVRKQEEPEVIHLDYEVIPERAQEVGLSFHHVRAAGITAGYWTAVGIAVLAMALVYVLSWTVTGLARLMADASRSSMRGLVDGARRNAPDMPRPRTKDVHVNNTINVSGQSGRVFVNNTINVR